MRPRALASFPRFAIPGGLFGLCSLPQLGLFKILFNLSREGGQCFLVERWKSLAVRFGRTSPISFCTIPFAHGQEGQGAGMSKIICDLRLKTWIFAIFLQHSDKIVVA
jgi:hypothetical protein